MARVFLAAPFTAFFAPSKERQAHGGTSEAMSGPHLAGLLAAFRDALRKAGYEVYSAHEEERDGRALRTPRVALEADFAELAACHLFVAVVGTRPISAGVQLELGRALTLAKPVVQVRIGSDELPYLNRALDTVASVSNLVVTGRPEEIDRDAAKLVHLVNRMLPA